MISHPYAALLSGFKYFGENFRFFSSEDRVLLETQVFCCVISYLAGHMGVTITFFLQRITTTYMSHYENDLTPLSTRCGREGGRTPTLANFFPLSFLIDCASVDTPMTSVASVGWIWWSKGGGRVFFFCNRPSRGCFFCSHHL